MGSTLLVAESLAPGLLFEHKKTQEHFKLITCASTIHIHVCKRTCACALVCMHASACTHPSTCECMDTMLRGTKRRRHTLTQNKNDDDDDDDDDDDNDDDDDDMCTHVQYCWC